MGYHRENAGVKKTGTRQYSSAFIAPIKLLICWGDLTNAELNTPRGEAHQVLTRNAHRFYLFLSLHLQLNSICHSHLKIGKSMSIAFTNNQEMLEKMF